MRPGDMDQWAEMEEHWQIENARAWKKMLTFGAVLLALLFGSFFVGLFFGWLIWGL